LNQKFNLVANLSHFFDLSKLEWTDHFRLTVPLARVTRTVYICVFKGRLLILRGS